MPTLRRHLQALKPYPIPVKPDGGQGDFLRLDANENFYPLDDSVLTAAEQACHHSQGYPDDFSAPLRQAISGVHKLDPERIACARGAMELISLLCTLYLEPGSNAVVSQYSYLYFRTAIAYSGANIVIAPERDLVVDIDALASVVDSNTCIVFLANPSNPCGTLVSNSEISELRRALADDILLVVDEAYAEYVDKDVLGPNFSLADGGNTVILRTFSKIYGLAGYRIGWGYFPEKMATELRIVQQPNCVSHVSQATALAAMNNQERVTLLGQENRRIREAFAAALGDIGLLVIPSHTNFLLVKFASVEAATSVEQCLRSKGILVRPMHAYQLPDYLRITIGTESQMQRVTEGVAGCLKDV